ncbi:sigma-70 family RNA polymerase sigma factor [Mucilaginibacter sp. SJ]|uniref:sigma-70 family RNA polymerase sigma factor n=1 Tax=Mucilaginibacter sp. SJ TaxID=3029053 RepID=UPI0023A91E77|nr:RNA polymerase sigma factor RpoD/SigA [Mucilaginibacter sp. SJ]WEA01787.1 RNA polymerase sigma factor RpoD/SigA [Mucilaginibacter sp. SJ]
MRKLVLSNLRFVISVAKKYQTKGISLSDLISEGNIGLITAACRFDHTRGFRFISYAVWWIRQAISTAVEEHTRLFHLPMNQVNMLNQYLKAVARKEQELHRPPSTQEIATEIGVDDHLLSELLQHTQISASLDHPINEEGSACLYDKIPHRDPQPDDSLLRESVATEISLAMRILDKREREILLLFFGLAGSPCCRLEDIAERLKLSVEHTRRVKETALGKLRHSPFAHQLRSCIS